MKFVLKECRQKIWVTGKHFPQHREQCFVGNDAFPGWFKPAKVICPQKFAKLFTEHEFPGVEFEHPADYVVFQITKVSFLVATNIFDIDKIGVDTGSFGTILKILDGTTVLFGIFATAKV